MNNRNIYKHKLHNITMVSKYDVFYVVATKGTIKVSQIAENLNKPKNEYQNIFNKVLELEREGFVQRKDTIEIVHTKKSKELFNLISFCVHNLMNYNLLFKKSMLRFLQLASKKEFFTIKNVPFHPQTFHFYITALEKYGFLFISSKNPLKCKLLRHHFLIALMKFFGRKTIFYSLKRRSFVEEIKKELSVYNKNLKINYVVLRGAERRREAGFIYSSLSLEGNPLTLPETQKLILENIIPEKHKFVHIQEVGNYTSAVDLMIKNSEKKIELTVELILKYHSMAMLHIPEAGKIRGQNVFIRLNENFKTCDWKLIPQRINVLIKKYNTFESEKRSVEEVITFASFFHNEFQRIHPFIDGNSRISRLLMLHILRSHNIPILDLPIGYSDQYLDLTKRSSKRDEKSFKNLIEEIVFINLRRLNRF